MMCDRPDEPGPEGKVESEIARQQKPPEPCDGGKPSECDPEKNKSGAEPQPELIEPSPAKMSSGKPDRANQRGQRHPNQPWLIPVRETEGQRESGQRRGNPRPESFRPESHSVTMPLIRGGPACSFSSVEGSPLPSVPVNNPSSPEIVPSPRPPWSSGKIRRRTRSQT